MKWLMAVMVLLFVNMADAADGRSAVAGKATWEKECGSCHLAYPPRFLNRESWQRMMGSLNRHFGDNAELDAEDARVIAEYLSRNAGTGARKSASTLRISDTPWFVREHDEVPKGAWSDPLVKSKANCEACHINAKQGDWSERGIVMPAGWGHEGDDDEEED